MIANLDPTPIFDLVRGNHATELLAAAVAHFDVFSRLSRGPLSFDDLRNQLGLARRPAVVLMTAIRGMGLVVADEVGRLDLSPLAKVYLVPGSEFYMGDYIGLVAQTPGVLAMVERLRTNKPASNQKDEGAAFIFRDGMESAMDQEESARRLTMALSGRAKIVAPVMAERLKMAGVRCLLDVGGGTGIYSLELLKKNPGLRAIVWDRAEVLKVAREFAAGSGVEDRMEFVAGDMFADPVPERCDAVLLSNILHDWDEPECRKLVARLALTLPSKGKMLIHDVFLNDALDGPLPLALYSAALFCITEGRAYSAGEYRELFSGAGISSGEVMPTLVHCGVLTGEKS